MSAGHGGVAEVVADGLPALAAVVGALHDLAVPARGLRRVDAVGIGGRSPQVVHLPAAPQRPPDLPVLALAVGRQHERTLARPHEHPHATHPMSSSRRLSTYDVPATENSSFTLANIRKPGIGSGHSEGEDTYAALHGRSPHGRPGQ